MAVKAFGATFSLHDGTSLVAVAEILAITPPGRTRETIDTTTHSSTEAWREFIGGLKDGGEVGITFHYVAGSASDDLLIEAFDSDTPVAFELTANAASGTEDIGGNCLITNYAPDALEIEGKQTASATFKVSGKLTQAATV